jgi:hypothetical protein
MNKLVIPVVAAAFLMAACGGAATIMSSTDRPANVGTVQGANAGSDVSDVNRVNPPAGKTGTLMARPAATPQTLAPASSRPSFGTGAERCGTGPGTGVSGNRASTAGSVKRHPLPMCAIE